MTNRQDDGGETQAIQKCSAETMLQKRIYKLSWRLMFLNRPFKDEKDQRCDNATATD
jgi:hypothetical protein